MIVFDSRKLGGYDVFFHTLGSALFNSHALPHGLAAGVIATVFANVSVINAWLATSVLQASGYFGGVSFIVSFVVVYRAQTAYQRYELSQIAYFNMTSKLRDFVSFVSAFTEPSKEGKVISSTVIRWIRAYHELAIEDFQGVDFHEHTRVNLTSNEAFLLGRDRKRNIQISSWIEMLLTEARQHIRAGDAILSRAFQILSDANLYYNNARRISETPFPFPFVQLTSMMIHMWLFMTPAVVGAVFPKSYTLAFFIAASGTWVLFAVNELAAILENPWEENDNNLPTVYYTIAFDDDMSAIKYMELPEVFESLGTAKSYHNDKPQESQIESSGPPLANVPAQLAAPTQPSGRLTSHFSSGIDGDHDPSVGTDADHLPGGARCETPSSGEAAPPQRKGSHPRNGASPASIHSARDHTVAALPGAASHAGPELDASPPPPNPHPKQEPHQQNSASASPSSSSEVASLSRSNEAAIFDGMARPSRKEGLHTLENFVSPWGSNSMLLHRGGSAASLPPMAPANDLTKVDKVPHELAHPTKWQAMRRKRQVLMAFRARTWLPTSLDVEALEREYDDGELPPPGELDIGDDTASAPGDVQAKSAGLPCPNVAEPNPRSAEVGAGASKLFELFSLRRSECSEDLRRQSSAMESARSSFGQSRSLRSGTDPGDAAGQSKPRSKDDSALLLCPRTDSEELDEQHKIDQMDSDAVLYHTVQGATGQLMAKELQIERELQRRAAANRALALRLKVMRQRHHMRHRFHLGGHRYDPEPETFHDQTAESRLPPGVGAFGSQSDGMRGPVHQSRAAFDPASQADVKPGGQPSKAHSDDDLQLTNKGNLGSWWKQGHQWRNTTRAHHTIEIANYPGFKAISLTQARTRGVFQVFN